MIILSQFPHSARAGLFAAVLSLAFAAPSFAGGANNSTVLDISEMFNATSGTSLDTSTVRFRAGQSTNDYGFGGDARNESTPGTYMVGYALEFDDDSEAYVSLTWFAFEPDSVKRSRNGISLRQRSDLALSVTLYGGNSTIMQKQGVLGGCSAKGKLKMESLAKASVSMKCPKSLWEDLGFTESEVEKIGSILGTTKLKIGVKRQGMVAR